MGLVRCTGAKDFISVRRPVVQNQVGPEATAHMLEEQIAITMKAWRRTVAVRKRKVVAPRRAIAEISVPATTAGRPNTAVVLIGKPKVIDQVGPMEGTRPDDSIVRTKVAVQKGDDRRAVLTAIAKKAVVQRQREV